MTDLSFSFEFLENKNSFINFYPFKPRLEMKKLFITSIFAAAAAAVNAAPLVTIGDQLDVFFKGSFTGKWDSNITYANNPAYKFNDYAGVFRLGAEADYGRNSKFKANVSFHEDLTRYAQRKEFNSDLAHVKATVAYVEANWSASAFFTFDQNYQNTNDTQAAAAVGELVRSDLYTAGAQGVYNLSDKMDVEVGFNWMANQYDDWAVDRFGYSDYDVYSVPVSLLYRVTEKISAGLTYSYRFTEFSGGSVYNLWACGDQRQDHFAGLTVRGELLPKLTAEVYLGGTYRMVDGILDPTVDDSEATLAMKFKLAYELTEKIGLFLNASRDFGNGASRQSSVNTGCEFGANYAVWANLIATASFSYTNYDYQLGLDREDNYYIARLGLNYKPNKFLTFGANYRYINNDSNLSYAGFNQHLIDFSIAVKY